MKVHELIKILQSVENKDRDVEVLIGNEDYDSFSFSDIEIHHADDCEQSVEIFCNDEFMFDQDYCCSVRDLLQFKG